MVNEITNDDNKCKACSVVYHAEYRFSSVMSHV